jgi:hypothetical protein
MSRSTLLAALVLLALVAWAAGGQEDVRVTKDMLDLAKPTSGSPKAISAALACSRTMHLDRRPVILVAPNDADGFADAVKFLDVIQHLGSMDGKVRCLR